MALTKISRSLLDTGVSDSSDATAITIDSSEKVGLNGLSAGDYWATSNQLVLGNTASAANGGMTIATATNAVGQIYFADGTSGDARYRGQIQYSHASDAMDFATAASFAMRIDSSGNLGIGTTTGDVRSDGNANRTYVSIIGNANRGVLNLGSTASAGADGGKLTFVNGTNAVGEIYVDPDSGSQTNGFMVFSTSNSERMRINSGGHVLVATTSDNPASGVGHKFIASSTEPYIATVVDSTQNHLSNYHHYNANASYNGYRFYIRNNGGVVNYSGNNVNLSDEKVKTNIELSGNYLEKICNIPVKLFNYKDEPEGVERSLGVIAQDVEAVAPELVNNEGFGDTPEDGVPLKTVYTTDMMYALMKAIQELSAKVEELESKINE